MVVSLRNESIIHRFSNYQFACVLKPEREAPMNFTNSSNYETLFRFQNVARERLSSLILHSTKQDYLTLTSNKPTLFHLALVFFSFLNMFLFAIEIHHLKWNNLAWWSVKQLAEWSATCFTIEILFLLPTELFLSK